MNIKKSVFILLLSLSMNVLYAGEISAVNEYKMCDLLATVVEAIANLRDLGIEQDVTLKLIKSKNTIENLQVRTSLNGAIETFVPQVYAAKDVPAELLKVEALKACLK